MAAVPALETRGGAPRAVVAIGPIPPPVTGFAVITERMIAHLSADREVHAVSVSPATAAKGARYHLSRIVRVLKAVGVLAARRRRARLAYLGCDGGFGLVYTGALVAAARLLGYATVLHHHNYTYIDRPWRLMERVLRIGGPRLAHIFLAESMAADFAARYAGTGPAVVVSNAAFVPPAEMAATAADDPARPLTIGLLSNLSRAKGLTLFLDLMRAADEAGLPLCGILAGPVADPADAAQVAEARSAFGDRLTVLGPVAGAAKAAFYRDIDVFVFPTTYANEAQPTVLFEAMAAGCEAIAYDRGCIASQLAGWGCTVPRNAAFVPPALERLLEIEADRRAGRSRRSEIAAAFVRLHHEARQAASTAMETATGPCAGVPGGRAVEPSA